MSSAAGCGQGTCDIQGRVTYQGKPVVYGGVLVVDDHGKTVSAGLDDEGHYVATGVRTGAVRFAVISSGPSSTAPPNSRKNEIKDGQEPDQGARAKPAATASVAAKSDPKWQPLPKQYADPEVSGIATVVKRGDNTFDIELK